MREKNLEKILKRVLKIILIIAIFIIISSTSVGGRQRSWLEETAINIVMIPQRFVEFLKLQSSDNEMLQNDIEELKNENKKLKDEIQRLNDKMADYSLVLQENNAFKTLEETKQMYQDYDVVIADVIGITQNNWDSLYIINKGKQSNIEPNMTVITSDGLVGYISEVGENTSKVISILDASSSFSALNSLSREQVIIKGDLLLKDNNELKVTNIPLKTIFSSGEAFETSGIGGIYPKGIKVGYVKEFIEKKNPTENKAIIQSYVDFYRLERVAIIVKK